MRRPRKPVPPNTVTVRPLVAAMLQTCQFMSEFLSLLVVEGSIPAMKQQLDLARHDNVVLSSRAAVRRNAARIIMRLLQW
jgi:hypothetical protein